MQIAMFYHSLISDWNHGNAHFLRGVVRELIERGHSVTVYEPEDGWSLKNLIQDCGMSAVQGFYDAYRGLDSKKFSLDRLDLDRELKNTDLVMVHEWNEPRLVRMLGQHRAATARYALLFHDTHHRAATAPDQMRQYDLSNFDGVLVFGEVLRHIYTEQGWARRAWVWHEAADVRLFHPPMGANHCQKKDLVWVGNWGDEERSTELRDFVMQPARQLALQTHFYGVRYPQEARAELSEAGIQYCGWLANYLVPQTFAQFRLTVHIPRRPYAKALPGIPTIRVFEALACGIPLVSSPWQDTENLFDEGREFLMARDGQEMREFMRLILKEKGLANSLAQNGRRRILQQHTCGHRVDQLLQIVRDLGVSGGKPARSVRHAPRDGHGWSGEGEAARVRLGARQAGGHTGSDRG